MSHKLLTVICALALVLGLSLSATAAVQNVKVGGDIETKGIYQNAYDIYGDVENAAGVSIYPLLANKPKVHDYLMSTTRIYVEASLTDNVSAMVRLLNERDWDGIAAGPVGRGNPVVEVDLAYLTLAEMYGYPFSLTIGRQEIKEGEGFLVGDGVRDRADTYQYGARKAFDAIKAVWNYDPHQIDIFIAKLTEGSNVAPGAAAPVDTDNDLYGIDWNYDGGVYGLWDLALFYNRTNVVGAALPLGDGESHTWALSIRGEGTMPQITSGTLALKGEIVREWGTVEANTTTGTLITGETERLDAWGGYAEAEYTFDNAYAPYFGLGYIFMSGDNLDNDPIQQFNPLFEDEKYGEIAEVVYGLGTSAFAPAAVTGRNIAVVGTTGDTMMTNVSIWKLSGGFNPTENTSLDLTYYSFTAPEEVTSFTADPEDQNRNIGSEYDLNFTYNYSEDVTFGVLYALFVPGKFFEMGASNLPAATTMDINLVNAQELMGSVKVTF